MELSNSCFIKPNHILSPLSALKPNLFPIPSQNIHTQKLNFSISKQGSRSTVVMECAKVGSMKKNEQEEDEWAGIGESWKEKCRGEGIEEVMECLEREAIMGEDHGREPNDYNRRAHIFDKSNKVFQALKERERNSGMLVS